MSDRPPGRPRELRGDPRRVTFRTATHEPSWLALAMHLRDCATCGGRAEAVRHVLEQWLEGKNSVDGVKR